MAADSVTTPEHRMRFTVNQYERTGEVGILDPDVRTELLDGEIVTMPPIEPDHAAVVEAITELVHERLRGRVSIRVEVAVTSLRFDRLVKLPICAQQGIVEVWIVEVWIVDV